MTMGIARRDSRLILFGRPSEHEDFTRELLDTARLAGEPGITVTDTTIVLDVDNARVEYQIEDVQHDDRVVCARLVSYERKVMR